MSPPAPQDQQLLDQLIAAIATIGTGSGDDWLTDPDQVLEGVPTDALDQNMALQWFVDHYQTTNIDPQTGTYRSHGWISRFRVWVAVKIQIGDATFGRATLRASAADLWRALQGEEGAFDVASDDEGLQFGTYQVRRDLEAAGFAFASIDIDVQRAQLHGAT